MFVCFPKDIKYFEWRIMSREFFVLNSRKTIPLRPIIRMPRPQSCSGAHSLMHLHASFPCSIIHIFPFCVLLCERQIVSTERMWPTRLINHTWMSHADIDIYFRHVTYESGFFIRFYTSVLPLPKVLKRTTLVVVVRWCNAEICKFPLFYFPLSSWKRNKTLCVEG